MTTTDNGIHTDPNPDQNIAPTPTPRSTSTTTPRSTRTSTPRSTSTSTSQRSLNNIDTAVADRVSELAQMTGRKISDIVALGEHLARRHLEQRGEIRLTSDEWLERMIGS